MKASRHICVALTFILVTGIGSVMGGQAKVAPIEDFLRRAGLVVIVDVKKVTEVEVVTGESQTSVVYVAEAQVLQTLKSDHTPTPKQRTIAIVGSTLPRSSAVWRPIEKKQYLAFLTAEQGHYRYDDKYDLRPISPERTVEWIEKNGKGDFEISALDVDKAVELMQSELANPKPVVASCKPQNGAFFTYTGYMTTVLELKDGRFRYWFETDSKAPNEPTYPLSGEYSTDGDTITLKHDKVSQPQWAFRSVNGTVTLWRPDAGAALETGKNQNLLDIPFLKKYGTGSIAVFSDKSAEDLWKDRRAPSR